MSKRINKILCILLVLLILPINAQAIAQEPDPEDFIYTFSKYSSTYGAETNGSTINCRIACEKINGTILMPNETFSFNEIVGERTEKNGFKVGTIVQNGEFVPGIGGGICRMSSVLFNAVLRGNFKIDERHQHGLKVNYVPHGRDSSISWGYQDLKFTNNLDVPVKIESTMEEGILTVKILTEHYQEKPNVIIKTYLINGKYYTYRYIYGEKNINYYCISKYKN
jgi:vancomycin resistance protein YoaR